MHCLSVCFPPQPMHSHHAVIGDNVTPTTILLTNNNGRTGTSVFLTQCHGGPGTSGFLKHKNQITMISIHND